ncbi:MAG: DUF4998 domain-containing protein [Bacteroidales bacterium]|jgi:hypothetical protein|nr:DUF4998 domain-containing protein [Bacteroidales bacterium]
MKKILMNTGYILLAISMVMIAACADLNDSQQQYLDRGERIYTGKADLLTVNGGHNRVQITGVMHYAKTAEYCIIRWTNGTDTDSLTVNASNWQATDTMKVILDGLSEGAYRIFVQTYDKDGNKSLNVECNGNAYGENFILSAKAKVISQMAFRIPSVLVLSWSVSEKAEFVEVVYESKTGNKTLSLLGNTETTELSDWKFGGEIKSRTAIIPEAGAIDTIYTDWLVRSFPTDDLLDKTKIIPLYLANDAARLQGDAANLFNGIIRVGTNSDSEFTSSYGIPNHLTFDLGVMAHLTRLEFWHTADDVWAPTAVQFWGIADTLGAEITTARTSMGDGGAVWEAEAVEKGWIKLVDGRCTSFFTAANEFISTNPAKIRFLIVRVTEVQQANKTGSSVLCKIGEVSLYSDDITEL